MSYLVIPMAIMCTKSKFRSPTVIHLHRLIKLLKIEILNGNETAPEFTYNDQTVTSLELNRTENNSTVIQLTTKDDWTGPIAMK